MKTNIFYDNFQVTLILLEGEGGINDSRISSNNKQQTICSEHQQK